MNATIKDLQSAVAAAVKVPAAIDPQQLTRTMAELAAAKTELATAEFDQSLADEALAQTNAAMRQKYELDRRDDSTWGGRYDAAMAESRAAFDATYDAKDRVKHAGIVLTETETATARAKTERHHATIGKWRWSGTAEQAKRFLARKSMPEPGTNIRGHKRLAMPAMFSATKKVKAPTREKIFSLFAKKAAKNVRFPLPLSEQHTVSLYAGSYNFRLRVPEDWALPADTIAKPIHNVYPENMGTQFTVSLAELERAAYAALAIQEGETDAENRITVWTAGEAFGFCARWHGNETGEKPPAGATELYFNAEYVLELAELFAACGHDTIGFAAKAGGTPMFMAGVTTGGLDVDAVIMPMRMCK